MPLYTSIETDMGQAPRAMVRLLERAKLNRNDPELFAGLFNLVDTAGSSALPSWPTNHQESWDPHILTSIPHTCFLLK